MTEREASCGCGRLRATCRGEPVRVSVCHCRNCQRRSGSAFAVQARWPDDQVALTGASREWSLTGDGGGVATFQFCPNCGATIAYRVAALPGLIAIPVGAFADSGFPAPTVSVYECRQHAWVALTDPGITHID